MMMTNGVGAYLGSKISGFAIDEYFTQGDIKDWHGIWLSFAIYSLIIAIAFAILFKHKMIQKMLQTLDININKKPFQLLKGFFYLSFH